MRARLDDPLVSARLLLANDAEKRQKTTRMARTAQACVAVNAGFFTREGDVAEHQGLLLIDGKRLAPLRDPARPNAKVYGARAALGFFADGSADIAWIAERGGRLIEWPGAGQPPHPGPEPLVPQVWQPAHALQGGQAVVMGGRRLSPGDNARHPRTAAGVTAGGELILLVADGRQRASRGLTLRELGDLMLELGCVEALNLDGGGSSTLVVAGERLNRPQGWGLEREVMTAIGLFCGP